MAERSNEAVNPVSAPTLDDLAVMDDRALSRHVAGTNETFNAAKSAYDEACEALSDLLTEQIARHVLNLFPEADLLRCKFVAEYHLDDEGDIDASCGGHDQRLHPEEVCAADGTVLGRLDGLSPVVYWLERLTPYMEEDDATLHLALRDWTREIYCDDEDESDEDADGDAEDGEEDGEESEDGEDEDEDEVEEILFDESELDNLDGLADER